MSERRSDIESDYSAPRVPGRQFSPSPHPNRETALSAFRASAEKRAAQLAEMALGKEKSARSRDGWLNQREGVQWAIAEFDRLFAGVPR